MKTLLTSLSLTILAVLGGCTSEAATGGGSGSGGGTTADMITQQVEQITAKLGGITDQASAESAKSAIRPMVDKLSTAMSGLKTAALAGGDDMLAQAKTALEPLIAKASELLKNLNPEALAPLKPLLEKITSLGK